MAVLTCLVVALAKMEAREGEARLSNSVSRSRSETEFRGQLRCQTEFVFSVGGPISPRAQTLFGNALVLAVTQPERARPGFPTLFPLVSRTNAMQIAGPLGSRAISSSFLTLNVSNKALGFDSPSRPPTSAGAKQSFAGKCVPKQSLGTRRRGGGRVTRVDVECVLR